MKEYRGSGGTAALILNVGTRRSAVSITRQPLYSCEIRRYPSSVSQRRFGLDFTERKIVCLRQDSNPRRVFYYLLLHFSKNFLYMSGMIWILSNVPVETRQLHLITTFPHIHYNSIFLDNIIFKTYQNSSQMEQVRVHILATSTSIAIRHTHHREKKVAL